MISKFTCEQAILALLAASGPQEWPEIKNECIMQATDYTPERVVEAVQSLIAAGLIVEDPDADEETYGLPGEV